MPSKRIKRIGVLTGGGDCPGLNAVIRAVVKTASTDYGVESYGIEDGYEGLIEDRIRPLSYDDVSGILTIGGTILGSSNRADPFRFKADGDESPRDYSDRCLDHIERRGLDALVCIGGDGTMSIAHKLMEKGVPVVGVPKTIDNDLYGTDVTFGFDSAVQIVSDAVDQLHTTAQSHHRVMIVETMGRHAGWLALHGGISGGGDVILIPEIPYRIENVVERVCQRSRRGRRFSIVVASEGIEMPGGGLSLKRDAEERKDIKLGGIGFVLARSIEEDSQISARAVLLGHLQRSGTPTAFDRILASRFGHAAMRKLAAGEFGVVVGLDGREIITTSLTEVADRQRTVPEGHPLVEVARSVGTSFGDE